jgi:hypothetical protein
MKSDPTPYQPDADNLGLIRDMPIKDRIAWLMHRAHSHSMAFQSPESVLARSRYIAQHPTGIIAFNCMDGRINTSVATDTPTGIILPLRNLGGRFDLGWPYFGEVLADHVRDMVGQGRRTLALITYHYSKGDPHRGCAGFQYNTDAARKHMFEIQRQMGTVFGGGHSTVYPLVCGFETDDDALVLHGSQGELLNISTLSSTDLDSLPTILARLYPDMPDQMRQDLLPLVQGNISHISKIRHSNRELAIEHHEWIIGIGRGFDWLQAPNFALLIGPYSPDLADPIRKAAGIIGTNMQSRRIPDDGFLLLAESAYLEIGADRARADLRSGFYAKFATGIIETEFPNLKEKMHVHSAVIDLRSRAMELIDRRPT